MPSAEVGATTRGDQVTDVARAGSSTSGGAGCAAPSVWISCGVSVSESATAFSFTCATEPDSGIAITLPLRMVQASATAAAEQPSLWHRRCRQPELDRNCVPSSATKRSKARRRLLSRPAGPQRPNGFRRHVLVLHAEIYPIAPIEHYVLLLDIAGAAWSVAFGLFVVLYGRVLAQPRIRDGSGQPI
jgi:hypothetical protein